MQRRDPPPTDEGWFALHDFRAVDWDAWRDAPDRERARAIEEGREYLAAAAAVEDADEGASAAYAVTGHGADLLVLHLRPTMAALNALERRFEHTALAAYVDRADSYVSVTEASGYTTPEYFEDDDADVDEGLRNYIETRLRPSVPDADHVCFYPMDKRRDPEANWYDLPFEERADHMRSHGEIGREYAGEVTQLITGSIGLDDHEWGVTLWSDDPTTFKDLLYEMRFDPSTSRFAEFGRFYTGRRLPPDRLGDFLAGESLADADGRAERADTRDAPEGAADRVRAELDDLDVYAGQPHGEDVHAVVVYSEADAGELADAVDDLRGDFEHYDTHVRTAVYEGLDGERAAVASLWDTERAAETAAGFLDDLPGVVARAGEGSGFGTMGLFYAVEPEHRADFVETFDEVVDRLEGMEGHLDTRLLANVDDENDLFIASQWRAEEDAMAFFRSDAFRDTVSWGRDILADRPRHVFLA